MCRRIEMRSSKAYEMTSKKDRETPIQDDLPRVDKDSTKDLIMPK
jgi:hypothetical protein